MKVFFGLFLSFVLMASMVSAGLVPMDDDGVPVLKVDKVAPTIMPDLTAPKPKAKPSTGRSKSSCYTEYGWNGEEWEKKSVVKRIHMYEGNYLYGVRIYEPVEITNYIEGSKCTAITFNEKGKKTSMRKPMEPGTVIDMEPLGLDWQIDKVKELGINFVFNKYHSFI